MKPVNPELKKYINEALSKPLYHPSMALCACIDAIFTGDDDPDNDKWWTFEYETVLEMMDRLGYVRPNVNILGQIQCIGAIRNGKHLIDKEWNLFENAVAALTGIPVLFYEKQNLPIENVIHAMRMMPNFGIIEYSDEVKHYIGCEAINDDIFWYPINDIDKYLYESLDRIKDTLGFRIEEIEKMRSDVQAKFNSLRKENLETIEFKEDNMTDQMCKRIMWSILKYTELQKTENEELNKFCNIRDGKLDFSDINTQTSEQKDPGEDYSDAEDTFMDNTGEVTNYEDGINPDDNEEVQIIDFNDGVKAASLDIVNNVDDNFIMPFDDMYHAQSIKIAASIGDGLNEIGYAVNVMQRLTKMAAIPHPYGPTAAEAVIPPYQKKKTMLDITDGEVEKKPDIKSEEEMVAEMLHNADPTVPVYSPDSESPYRNTELEKTSSIVTEASIEETANGNFHKCGMLNVDPFLMK